MKYISVIFTVLFMVWTWSLANSQPAMDLAQHKNVERALEQVIRDSIKKEHPEVKDIIFRQLFTESLDDTTKVRAKFRYEVISPTTAQDVTTQIIEGSALLDSADGGQSWTMSNLDLKSPSISYEHGLRVSREGTNAQPSAEKPAKDAEPAEPSESNHP
jgi:hypothetical protein